MSTVSRGLPAHPHLDVPKRQARELLQQCKERSSDAFDRIRRRHPRFQTASDDGIIVTRMKLSDAQLVIAREYGFSSWTQLKQRINSNTVSQLIDKAIRANDAAEVIQLLTAYPDLLHVPVRNGNWGPPMSHAANMAGRLDMVKAIAALGARDFQHAFDRALLQGNIEIAKWLHEHGAVFTPGIIMGCCETLNERGFAFLDDAGIPLTNEKGDRLAPLAMVLETYSRNPAGKHAILQRFRARRYHWPDTPVMAFHCGDLDRLNIHLRQDPQVIHRRFGYREIYPPELGCADDMRSGLHGGTPIDGTTLLHLSIDFEERAIFDWLLTQGADINAAAFMDDEGFGGQTPLFHAVFKKDTYYLLRLLEHGADTNVRINLRKYIDWREEPGWHIARNITPLEWAADFPERDWVSQETVVLLQEKLKSSDDN